MIEFNTVDLNDKQIEILLAAEKLFSLKGYDGTSVRDIAKEAEVNLAMINYYFGSKDKTLQTLIKWRASKFILDADGIRHIVDPVQRLCATIEMLITFFNSNRRIFKVLYMEGVIRRKIYENELFIDLKKKQLMQLKAAIQYGIDQKVFKDTVPPVLVLSLIAGSFVNLQINEPLVVEELALGNEDSALTDYISKDYITFLQSTILEILLNEKK